MSSAVIKTFDQRPVFIIDDLARRVSCASFLVGVVERCQHCLRRRM